MSEPRVYTDRVLYGDEHEEHNATHVRLEWRVEAQYSKTFTVEEFKAFLSTHLAMPESSHLDDVHSAIGSGVESGDYEYDLLEMLSTEGHFEGIDGIEVIDVSYVKREEVEET